jgi:hypothetical protein
MEYIKREIIIIEKIEYIRFTLDNGAVVTVHNLPKNDNFPEKIIKSA